MSKKPKKEVKKILNLEGELLKIVAIYNEFNEQKKISEEEMKILKPQIVEILNDNNVTKAKSQLYTVNNNHVKQEKVSTKKLKEELFARGEQELWESCLYTMEYDRLTVKKIKGGENIF